MWKPDGTVRKELEHFNKAGHAHELTFTCHHRWPLLSRDRSRQWVIEALELARLKHGVELWAYVIMPEHFHGLIHPPGDSHDMADILQTIKQSVARKTTNYLREHASEWLQRLKVVRPSGRVEYRFWEQGGGYDRNIFSAEAAWASVRYLHDNPVLRGSVACATDWTWSSARWYAGAENVPLRMNGAPPAM